MAEETTPGAPGAESPDPVAALMGKLAMGRAFKSVLFDDSTRTWQVLRYDEVVEVLTDASTYSAQLDRVMPLGTVNRGNLGFMDPPEHNRARALVNQAFTPRTVNELGTRMETITKELLDGLSGRAEFDLIADFAYTLPVITIAELLGVPPEDRVLFHKWAQARASTTSAVTDVLKDENVMAALREQTEYFGEHARTRRANPGDDLLSQLTQAELDGDRLDEEEIANFAGLLLMAGHVTATSVIASAVLALDANPEQAAALRAEPALMPAAIEETIRYYPPLSQAFRVTTRDVELGGEKIPEGQLVVAWLLSANHDERRFTDPQRFDIRRDPNPHIGFSRGVHFCLGAALARLEIRIALEGLYGRFPGLKVLPGVEWHDNLRLIGPRVLPVRTGP
ncbi:MAG TPA: cytochrome P450 [Streptomyces sp.]|uniref:cytochrome P450 n=1 Tax=Streptomyces sp. TaxID=1931 RepID=UPI002D352914|nr:cytochrome P450 [Streptomyces sp.]HZG07169.1 cytochrome P450 [Streptomyces sp.]